MVAHLWRDYGASADRDEYTYGYDRNSNRLYRENTTTGAADELYAYDKLDRLTTMHRGDLNVNKDAIATADRSYGQAWGLSAVGNWDDFQIDHDGDGTFTDADDLDQDRTHNGVNEITGVSEQGDPAQSAWADPGYDAAGNMTTVPKPTDLDATYACAYDAWGRLVEVKSGATVVARYEYDGLNRRIKKHVDTDAPASPDGVDAYRHFYYDRSWRLLEMRESAAENTAPNTLQPVHQYVWSVRYIDAAICRNENTDSDDLCDDERLYYLNDANMNVTCLVDTAGDAQERYRYDAYGAVTVLDGDGTADDDGVSDYDNSIRYCGYFRDAETGLDCVRHRYRQPYLGWITRDPLGYPDGPNRYAYARCRPLVFVDPDGRVVLYAEGAVSKFPGMEEKSEAISDTLKGWAKKHGQEHEHYKHRRAWWDPVGLFTGQYFNQRQINNNAEDMFERMKEACKDGDPIYIYAHSTGAVTAARAIVTLHPSATDSTGRGGSWPVVR